MVFFAIGVISSLLIGALIRVFIGLRMNLYLVSQDSPIHDQALIPITAEGKKNSRLRSLLRGSWKEDIDITLIDHGGHAYTYRIGYSLWRRYYLILLSQNLFTGLTAENPQALLGGTVLLTGKRYPLRTGMTLQNGDRAFQVMVTPGQVRRKDPQGESTDLMAGSL